MKENKNCEQNGLVRLFKENATRFFGADDDIHFLSQAQKADIV
jgi:hypothetical protein